MRILASEARRISDNSQHPKFDEQDYDFDTIVEEDLDKGEFIVQEVDK